MSRNYLEISKTLEQPEKVNLESLRSKISNLLLREQDLLNFVSKSNFESNLQNTNYLDTFHYFNQVTYQNVDNAEKIHEDLIKPKVSITEKDLSDYVITSEGLVDENWTSVVTIPSQIIEVNEHFVVMECLLDYEKKILEKRKFKKNILEKKFNLILFNILILKIFEKPGKIQFEFKDGKHLGYERYFSVTDYIGEIDSIETGKLIK